MNWLLINSYHLQSLFAQPQPGNHLDLSKIQENFWNNTYSWEEIFHPQTLKVLKNESLYNVTQTYASYYGLCFTMQKLTPERVSDYSFQIVVNNTVDYIYYLHEPYENEYLFMSIYPHEGKYHNKKR